MRSSICLLYTQNETDVGRFDVLECSIFDSKPRFPLPPSFNNPTLPQGDQSPSLQRLLLRLSGRSDGYAKIATALEASAKLAHFVNQHAQEPHFWKEAATVARVMTPIMHLLWALPRPIEHDPAGTESSEQIHFELIRLALLIVITRLKQMFSLISEELHTLEQRFLEFTSTRPCFEERFPELALWAHVVVATRNQTQSRNVQVSAISRLMISMRIQNSEETVQCVKQLVWIDALMDPGITALESDIDNARRPFPTSQQTRPASAIGATEQC